MAVIGCKMRRGLLLLGGTLVMIFLTLLRSLSWTSVPQAVSFTIQKSRWFKEERDFYNPQSDDKYLVNTPYCKIQNFDPFDETIRRFIKYKLPDCKETTTVLYQDGLYLSINWTVVQSSNETHHLKYCTLIPIYRPNNQSTHHNYFTYLKETPSFNEIIKVEHDFVRVNCYDDNKRIVYVDFRAFVIPIKSLSNQISGLQMPNVLLIGMDSVSRLSFLRQMNKTRKLIDNNEFAYTMMGYNKIDDNTFVNVVPLSLGKLVSELPWNKSQTFDNFDFIWKEFSQKGYRTLFAEDWPDASTFDYLKKGFDIPPVDHFYRPFSIAMEKEKSRWANHFCFQSRFESSIMLNYTYDFFNAYTTHPVFAFTFISKVTHDDDNGASKLDDAFYNFFSRLSVTDTYKNTFIFFFSDHGIRYGNIRSTYIGKLEERLPFMHIIIPAWFQNKFQEVVKTLKSNQKRLSTPFDVYETLQDILHYHGQIKQHNTSLRRISWFNEIPSNRTCENAGILPHWCTCLQHEILHNDHATAKKASEFLIAHINKLTEKERHNCELLSVFKIHRAERLYQSDQVVLGHKGFDKIDDNELRKQRKQAFDDIQITIETVPGNAMFEASVRIDLSDTKVHKLLGDISRINKYGVQSLCVNDRYLKLFCFCKHA